MRGVNRLVLTLAVLVAAAAVTFGCGSDDEATAEVPRSFFGIASQDTVSNAELARMGQGRVGSYHLLLSWARVERDAGLYDWREYDRLLAQLAINGIEPIPYLFGTPERLGRRSSPPTESQEALRGWARFLREAARRYGPGGTFWQFFALTHPEVEPRPLRIWEIWNEPNGPAFWHPRPDPAAYAELLLVSARALRQVNPDARIMFAGMFATPQSPDALPSFRFLRQALRVDGVAEAVDEVAIHPYGPRLEDVREQITRTRKAMREAGLAGSGLWLTEFGWGSDTGIRSQFIKPPKQQARVLRRTYELLIRRRESWRVQGALWFTWRDARASVPACSWCASAGLFERDLDPKPAWRAFTRMTGGRP